MSEKPKTLQQTVPNHSRKLRRLAVTSSARKEPNRSAIPLHCSDHSSRKAPVLQGPQMLSLIQARTHSMKCPSMRVQKTPARLREPARELKSKTDPEELAFAGPTTKHHKSANESGSEERVSRRFRNRGDGEGVQSGYRSFPDITDIDTPDSHAGNGFRTCNKLGFIEADKCPIKRQGAR